MPEHLLFYAGCDKKHEQIGLAVSQDGIRFERAGDDGLIVPVDPAVRWRDLRTCNPAVVRPDGTAGRFVMFFQGISTEQENVSIARAVSADGRTWTVDPEPCISWRELVAPGDGGPGSTRKAVFEPSVLHEDGRYRMWFCHLNAPVHASVSLFYAESRDGERWELERRPLLSGDTFGFCALHYPQVRRLDPGYELLFTLRSRRTLVDGIYRATSADGLSWSGAEPVLRRPLRMVRSRRNVAAKAWHRVARRFWRADGQRILGYSHPHVVEGEPDVMYIHNNHHGPRGRWYDVARVERHGGRWGRPETVFEPAADPDAWDSLFVADPFVVLA